MRHQRHRICVRATEAHAAESKSKPPVLQKRTRLSQSESQRVAGQLPHLCCEDIFHLSYPYYTNGKTQRPQVWMTTSLGDIADGQPRYLAATSLGDVADGQPRYLPATQKDGVAASPIGAGYSNDHYKPLIGAGPIFRGPSGLLASPLRRCSQC